MKKIGKMFGRIFCLSAAFILFFSSGMVTATSNSKNKDDFIDKFSQYSIKFYNPDTCSNKSGSTSAAAPVGDKATVSGSTAKEKIWSGLKSMGVTDEVAAGIMGNMQGESGFGPTRYENAYKSEWEGPFDWENDPKSAHGVGLIQWSGGRRVNFFKYARGVNSSLVDEYLKKPGTYGSLDGDSFIKTGNDNIDCDISLCSEDDHWAFDCTHKKFYKGN